MTDSIAADPAELLARLNAELAEALREQADAAKATQVLIGELPRDPITPQERDAAFTRHRAADNTVRRLTIRIEQARADARAQLESSPLLAELNTSLAATRTRLADAAGAAVDALAVLLEAAADYRRQVDGACVRLNRNGFDTATRSRLIADGFPADQFPTVADGARLHIAGVAWPALDPGAALAWAVARVAGAAGPSGRNLSTAAANLLGTDSERVGELLSTAQSAGTGSSTR